MNSLKELHSAIEKSTLDGIPYLAEDEAKKKCKLFVKPETRGARYFERGSEFDFNVFQIRARNARRRDDIRVSITDHSKL